MKKLFAGLLLTAWLFVSAQASAAITIIGSVTQATTNLVGKTPTGCASGDLLVFYLSTYDHNADVITPPTGAVFVNRINHASGGDDAIYGAQYYLSLASTPAATYTFTSTSGVGDVLTICLRGVNNSAPTDTGTGAPATNGGFSITPTISGITTTLNNELGIWYWYGDDRAITTPPSGWTAQIAGTGSPNNLGGGYYGLYTKTLVTAGATGIVQADTSGVDDWIVMLTGFVPSTGAHASMAVFCSSSN